MPTTLKSVTIETQLSVTVSDIAVSGTSENLFLGQVTFTNTSTSNVEVIVWRLLSTSSTATEGSGGNWLTKKIIAPGKEWTCYPVIGHILGNNQVVKAKADTANVINVDISGTSEI